MLIMVLIANPGKIPDRTPGDFGCREDFDRKEFCFPSQIPATLPPRYPLPAKNPGKIPTGIPPRFWPPGIPPPAKNPGKIPAEILAAGNPASRQESRQDSRRDPAEILAAGIPPPAKNPVKNPGGQNLGGIPAGILAGSCQDPAKIPVPFLQGRFIGENIRLIDSVINYAATKNIPGLLLFLDFEKAFDTLEWPFIQKTLVSFGFGPSIVQWFKTYCGSESCILNNGWASNFFPVHRGVRQGCPLSPYIFLSFQPRFLQKKSEKTRT